MTNYHYRSNYERLLLRLIKERGDQPPEYPLSKRELFENLNYYLILNDCTPFTAAEIGLIELI